MMRVCSASSRARVVSAGEIRVYKVSSTYGQPTLDTDFATLQGYVKQRTHLLGASLSTQIGCGFIMYLL